jgi:phage shock protein A
MFASHLTEERHMAGFFGRLRNLWKGFLSIWISDVEKKHPEIAYENAINSMIEKYTNLKKATAAIIRRREEIEARLADRNKELAQVTADLNTALETNQQDLGMVLIQKQKALTEECEGLKGDMQQAVNDADSAKASLTQVQGEIKKLKAEKDANLAKMASAEARLRIQEQLEGLSLDNEVKALDGVREHIKNTIAQANLNKELGESDLDARLKQLRSQTGDVTAKSEWERLQAARAAAKAGQKTM